MFNMMQPPQKYPYNSCGHSTDFLPGNLDFLKGYSIPKTAILRKDSLWPYYKILIK